MLTGLPCSGPVIYLYAGGLLTLSRIDCICMFMCSCLETCVFPPVWGQLFDLGADDKDTERLPDPKTIIYAAGDSALSGLHTAAHPPDASSLIVFHAGV